MDFNETLEKLSEIVSQQDILKAKRKEAALVKFKAQRKLKPGEDIMADPNDITGKKWKVIPTQISRQASNNTLSR
jgi:hypothetical protein